ncbi:MAG: hypothetical protein JWQ98_1013 [Chlorobi bacterium]|nr:hypothetical protein [Chlorobiota bacterium]
MKFIPVFLAVALLAGCSKNRVPDTKNVASGSAVRHDSARSTRNVGNSFRNLAFDKARAAREFKVTGKISGGAHWADANGENTLIISEESTRDKKQSDVTIQKIFGYLYAQQDSTRLLWKMEDNAENYCDHGVGLASNIIVQDLDGDGVAENLFVYNIAGACDVSPVQYKLMLHSGSRKFAVRGNTHVKPGGTTVMGGEKKFDADFASAPASYKQAASDLWDKIVGAAALP